MDNNEIQTREMHFNFTREAEDRIDSVNEFSKSNNFEDVDNIQDNYSDISMDDASFTKAEEDAFRNFGAMLAELNKQVSNADGSVNSLIQQKNDVEAQRDEINRAIKELERDRKNFENQIKAEYDKLDNAKANFESEKNKVYNSIQRSREELAKRQRDFEKYRKDQIEHIANSKESLKKSYEQFEGIVATFNTKIDKNGSSNK